jgi:hypothetical protein
MPRARAQELSDSVLRVRKSGSRRNFSWNRVYHLSGVQGRGISRQHVRRAQTPHHTPQRAARNPAYVPTSQTQPAFSPGTAAATGPGGAGSPLQRIGGHQYVAAHVVRLEGLQVAEQVQPHPAWRSMRASRLRPCNMPRAFAKVLAHQTTHTSACPRSAHGYGEMGIAMGSRWGPGFVP